MGPVVQLRGGEHVHVKGMAQRRKMCPYGPDNELTQAR
jgi:hypothetical protein